MEERIPLEDCVPISTPEDGQPCPWCGRMVPYIKPGFGLSKLMPGGVSPAWCETHGLVYV
jgi:hypothetical protein